MAIEELTLGTWLRQRIKERGITQEQAAAEIGVKLRELVRWLSGTSRPTLENWWKVEATFGPFPGNGQSKGGSLSRHFLSRFKRNRRFASVPAA